MEIGTQEPSIRVEPVEDPFKIDRPVEQPAKEPLPMPVKQPEKVPA
jgi:hypothetical protein